MEKIIELMEEIKGKDLNNKEIYIKAIRADMLAKELLKKMCISYSNMDNITIRDLIRVDRWCPRAKEVIPLLLIRYMDDETYLFKGVYKRRRSKEIVITIKDEIYYYN